MKKTIALISFFLCCVFAFSACEKIGFLENALADRSSSEVVSADGSFGSQSAAESIGDEGSPDSSTLDRTGEETDPDPDDYEEETIYDPPLIAPPETAVVFYPVETPSDRNAELFWSHLSDLSAGMRDYYSSPSVSLNVYNHAPDEIIDQYGFNAFTVKDGPDFTSYFEYYNGKLYCIYNSMPDVTVSGVVNNHGYVHFAIADQNEDGYGEIYTSFIAYRTQPNALMNHTNVSVYDSKLNKKQEYYEYKRTVYFKEDAAGKLSVYKTDADSYEKEPIELANTLSDPLSINTNEYRFLKRTFETECETFRATVTFAAGDVKFPVILRRASIRFNVTVEMTYLGESFDYTVGYGYKDGATCLLFNDSSQIRSDSFAVSDVISNFHVEKGEVITREYSYSAGALSLHDEGVYNAMISYRGVNAPVVERVIEVSRPDNLEEQSE